jgi:hypothetical protein
MMDGEALVAAAVVVPAAGAASGDASWRRVPSRAAAATAADLPLTFYRRAAFS